MMEQTDAADVYFSAVWQQTAGQHLQCGGFTRAVMPEQAQHFSTLQLQRHIMNNLLIAKAAHQVVCGKCDFGNRVVQSPAFIMVVEGAKYNLI